MANAADMYPAALFELFQLADEIDDLKEEFSDRCKALVDRLNDIVENLGLVPAGMTREEHTAYWDPFWDEFERRRQQQRSRGHDA